MQDQGLCRVRDQESKVRVIPRARVQGLEQGSRSGFKDQGQNSRVRAVPRARVRVRVRGTDQGSGVRGRVRRQESKIRAIPRDRVQGQLRGERRGKVRTIYRTKVQVCGSRVG